MTNRTPDYAPSSDEIDLSALFATLWRRRWLIVLGTLAVTVLVAGLTLILPRAYRSVGFYQFGSGVPIPVYKRSASMFSDAGRLAAAVRSEPSLGERNKGALVRRVQQAGFIKRWLQPVFAFSKEDQRELALIGKEEGNSVLGLNMAFEARTPERASTVLTFLGRYVRDCLMYVTLFNYISENASDAQTDLQKNENARLENRFNTEQQGLKLADMQGILRRYPESARIENRQLVSVQDGGARYLSPVTQLVGIEAGLSDLRRELAQLERGRKKALVRVEFFARAKGLLDRNGTRGEPLFAGLKALHRDLFSGKDLGQDEVREVYNDLSIAIQNYDRNFSTAYRFIAGPSRPLRPVRPERTKIVLVAGFLAFLFFVCLALVLSWWQKNKQTILNK